MKLVAPLVEAAGKAQPDPKPKLWRSPVIRIGGSALILTVLLTVLPFHQVWSAMKRIPPRLGLGLLCAYLLLHLLGVVKWRMLINTAGANLTFSQSVRCYYSGLFGNLFLPSLVGGDLVRAGTAFLVSRSKSAIVLGSLTDRVQDVIGLLVITTIGVLLVPTSLSYQSHKRLWSVGIVLLVGGALGLGSLLILPARRFPMKIRRIMVKFRRGIRLMYGRPGRMFGGFRSRDDPPGEPGGDKLPGWGGLRTSSCVQCLALCLAAGQTFGARSDDARRHRGSRTRSGGPPGSVWRTTSIHGRGGTALSSHFIQRRVDRRNHRSSHRPRFYNSTRVAPFHC